jgi:RNA polymerase sigma-70 factor (ECF subfamily)
MSETADRLWDWPLIRNRCKTEAFRILRRDHDAEEAVQEALVRAWRSRASCRTPETPLPWCLQITRNEAMRLVTRKRVLEAEPLESTDHIGDPRRSEQPETALHRIDVDRALRKLTARERLLIGLRYEMDWAHQDIAATLCIPETTARVHLHRAHKRLRALLEDQG